MSLSPTVWKASRNTLSIASVATPLRNQSRSTKQGSSAEGTLHTIFFTLSWPIGVVSEGAHIP